MLTTVEAEIDVNGKVELLEPVKVATRMRAIVTLLEEKNGEPKKTGNSNTALEFLQNNRLPESLRPTNEEIEAQILEARNSWD